MPLDLGPVSTRLFTELMTSDVGLMSAAGILFRLGMGAFYSIDP
jgi:hypothetical protein